VKSEKGITLISLTIYLTAMCLVIAMLATFSNLFYSNTAFLKEESKNMSEYNKFNMYFIEDVKNNKEVSSITNNEIVFEDGTIYTYKASPDNSIYRNKVKICKNIAYCKFTKDEQKVNNTTKKIIDVYMIISGTNLFETSNQYVLKYW